MKKLISLFSILITLLIITCVVPNQVKAEEETWYTEAANNAGNPVLLEKEQYFQGISINSHLISDLTFMEIPFEKYILGDLKEVQVITFSEALYTKDGKIGEEIVMYVYYPDKYNGDNQNIVTEIDFENQRCLVGSDFVDTLSVSDANTTYSVTWSKVSSYENITKYSFSKVRVKYANFSLSKWLLNDYASGLDVTEVQTIFNVNIKKFKMKKNTTAIVEKNDGDFFNYQQFQFISNKRNTAAVFGARPLSDVNETKEHINTCVASNNNSVIVSGEAAEYRYTMDEIGEIGWIEKYSDADYVYVNYFFFNVTDNEGTAWSSKEKYIKEVKLNYLEILGEATISIKNILASDPTFEMLVTLSALDSNGKVKYKTSDVSNFKESEWDSSSEKYVTFYEKFVSEIITDESLYKLDVITPKTYTIEYLEDSTYNEWVKHNSGTFNTRVVTYETLFSTNSDTFKEKAEKAENHDYKFFDEYDYGLVFGKKGGYPSHENVTINLFTGGSAYSYYTSAELVNFVDIEYEEDGETYRVTVSETNVDRSNTNSFTQEDDIWPDTQGDGKDRREEKSLIDKIIEFFTETLPKWWSDNKTAIIGVLITVGFVIVGIFIWRFLSPIITAIATKKAVEQASKKKEK